MLPQTTQPEQQCSNESTFFYGAQLTLIPGIGAQASAGGYKSSAGANGSFVSGGIGGGSI